MQEASSDTRESFDMQSGDQYGFGRRMSLPKSNGVNSHISASQRRQER